MSGPEQAIKAQITFLDTTDLVSTAKFYEEVLGLRLAVDQGRCRIYAVTDSAFLGFCQRDRAEPREGVILTLVTEDVDEFAGRLSALGAVLEKGPEYNPEYDIYHFFVRDPNGYKVEVQRFENAEI